MLLSISVATLFRPRPSVFGLILCFAVALCGASPCVYAENGVSVAGEQFSVETKPGHGATGTSQPTDGINAHIGEIIVGSSGAACALAYEGAIRYADKKLYFCDGEGWRALSTASPPP